MAPGSTPGKRWLSCAGNELHVRTQCQGGTNTQIIQRDTRFADPIEAGWQVVLDGKVIHQDKKTLQVAPGHAQEFPHLFSYCLRLLIGVTGN